MASIASTQLGAAIAKGLFAVVSPMGMVSLRVGFAALVLLLLWRPRWRGHAAPDYWLLLVFGLSLAAMNAMFYAAIARIPTGVAVALEFSGPLAVALIHSRQRLDMVWVGFAAAGIALLAPVEGSALDPVGVLLALLAGVGWGAYILFSAKVGRVFQGGDGLALAMGVGAVVLLPLGAAADGLTLLQPRLLLLGFAVSMLSSALPYSLELSALRRMSLNFFGVLLSLEPAIASLISLMVLGEMLTVRMTLAILLVTVAAFGVAQTQPPPVK
ncbi:MAG: EamA family transporter [Cyanobacteria bacterium Co-bin13]|nr:EamA family transporter [Cyanobacteria bacterium Co-bin13]